MSWDLFGKTLVKECPQDFIAYFAPNAHFVGIRETNLQTQVDGPVDPREIRGDIILEAELGADHFFVGIEWQSSKDPKMDERLLGYSCEITRVQRFNVLPCVIYTRPVSDAPRPPLERTIPVNREPGKRPMLWFDFESLELSSTPVGELRALQLDAFYALMPLCEGGNKQEILEEVFQYFLERRDECRVCIAAAFFFASKVLTSAEDQKFLERKYTMLDELLKDNWVYEKMLAEGRAQGRAQGRAEGRAEGRLQEARRTIEVYIEKRFPSLLLWARTSVAQINDASLLEKILNDLFMANTAEEATAAFSLQQ